MEIGDSYKALLGNERLNAAQPVPQPTPYPDVNSVLHRLCAEAQTIIGARWVGMYLYGSLASGDFDPQRSDIDFVVVTTEALPVEIIQALETVHLRLKESGLKWATKLEGAYVPQHTLRRYDPAEAPCPGTNEGKFYIGHLGSDWIIQRYILREHGVVVAGPAPQPLIDPLGPDDLRQAVQGILKEWWSPMLQNPARLCGSEYQAFAVLTMCRALYTLHHGAIVSKPTAARWARGWLGDRWAMLIEQALAWQPDSPGNDMKETLTFIRETLERARQLDSAHSMSC